MILLFLFGYAVGFYLFVMINDDAISDHISSHVIRTDSKATVIGFIACIVFLLAFCWWIIYADFLFDYFKQKYKEWQSNKGN